MAVALLDDMILRLVAMCAEATPTTRHVLDYLLGDYPHYPHWRVGERSIAQNIEQTEQLNLEVEALARLYGGKVGGGYKGEAERALRPLAEVAAQYFAEHLRLTSTAYPTPMPYIRPQGIQLGTPRKVVDTDANDGPLIFYEFTWTIPFRVPRDI